jgi:drug/metabolite transporter (DMT)-like permease
MSETKTLHQRDVVVTELLLIAMAVIWGCNFTVNKYGTQVLEPLVYTSIRMAAGTLAMLGFATLGRSARATTAEKLKLTGLGLLGHGAYQLLFIYGISRTRAGTAALVIASSPAIIALVMRTFRDERLPPRALLGIALSILGIGVVMAGSAQEGHGGSSVIGDLMILGAVFCWGFYTMWLKPLTHIEGTQLAAWTLLGGTAPLILMAAPAMLKTDFHAVVPLTWAAIAYSGLLSMGLAYLFWYRGVRVIGPTRTAMFSNLQPIVAVLVSWPLLGERPTPWQGVGALGVMVGLWLTRKAPPAEPAHGE